MHAEKEHERTVCVRVVRGVARENNSPKSTKMMYVQLNVVDQLFSNIARGNRHRCATMNLAKAGEKSQKTKTSARRNLQSKKGVSTFNSFVLFLDRRCIKLTLLH